MERMRQAEYARARQISRQRVHQLVTDGRIPLDGDGRVMVEQADANLMAMLDQRKAHTDRQIELAGRTLDMPLSPAQPAATEAPAEARPNAATDYWEHKARREKIEADRAELAYRKAVGEVVDAAEVARSRRETAHKVATALLQIPAQVAPVIAPQDPQRAERLLTEEIHRVINELAGDLERPDGDDAVRPAVGAR